LIGVALLLSMVLVLSLTARAGVLLSAGSNLAFEYANNGRTFESRQPFALRGGYRFDDGDLLLERSTFSVAQGTAAVKVRRSHEEWLAWARRVFGSPLALKPYAALGGGLQSEKVETTLNGATTTNGGRAQALAAAAAGFTAETIEGVTIDLELRASTSSGYSPNPIPQFGFFVGWRY
jgi:hypothetical protein